MLLRIDQLQVRYGGITALSGISIDVPEGETVLLVGANGAGKSSTITPSSAWFRPPAAASSSTARTSPPSPANVAPALASATRPRGAACSRPCP